MDSNLGCPRVPFLPRANGTFPSPNTSRSRLYKCRFHRAPSPACECEHSDKYSEHLLRCTRFPTQRGELRRRLQALDKRPPSLSKTLGPWRTCASQEHALSAVLDVLNETDIVDASSISLFFYPVRCFLYHFVSSFLQYFLFFFCVCVFVRVAWSFGADWVGTHFRWYEDWSSG